MKKILSKLLKFIKRTVIIFFALFSILFIAALISNAANKKKGNPVEQNQEIIKTEEKIPKQKINSQKEEKKLHITPEQEEIIKEHYELYYKLSPSANSGEELDKISDEISEQMCKKYNMTRKEYDDMWDIYNFGYILED